MPLRPIISTVNAPSYQLSKWLAKTLSPVLGSFSDSHLQHNQDLLKYLKSINPSGGKLISFVSALFTNVPLIPTLDFLRRKLKTVDLKCDAPVECLIEMIELCLKDSYFQFEDCYYQQIFGIPMGSCLSPILAGLFLEHVESEILPLYAGPQPLFWKRYVDDVLCLVPKDFKLESYLHFLNSIYPSLKFTYEWETERKIPFLDVLIENCSTYFQFSVYRKPTHSESYLHYYSYCAESIKLSVAKSLFLRAYRVCGDNNMHLEINHIKKTLKKLAYPDKVLSKALSKAKQHYYRFDIEVTPPKKECSRNLIIPFLPDLLMKKKSLQSFNTDVVFTYKNKLSSALTYNKPKTEKKIASGVYEIPCSSCPKLYVGETGRDIRTRMREHQYDIITSNPESAVAQHTILEDHRFDFSKAKIIHPCSNRRRRHVIESALIQFYSKKGLSVNLNSGFTPHNDLFSRYIKDVLDC